MKEIEKQRYIESTDGDGKAEKEKGDSEGAAWSKELGKLGFDWFKDQGHRKHGWKNVYHKEEWGDSKKYHDIFHDRDWKKKWNKWDKEKEKKQKEQIKKTIDKKKQNKSKAAKSVRKQQHKKGKHAMGSHLKSDNRKHEKKGDSSRKKKKTKEKKEKDDSNDDDDHESKASKHVYHQKTTGKKMDRRPSHHHGDQSDQDGVTGRKSGARDEEDQPSEITRNDVSTESVKQKGNRVPTVVTHPRRTSPNPDRHRHRIRGMIPNSRQGKEAHVYPVKGKTDHSSGRSHRSRLPPIQEKRGRNRSKNVIREQKKAKKNKMNKKKKQKKVWNGRNRNQEDQAAGKKGTGIGARGAGGIWKKEGNGKRATRFPFQERHDYEQEGETNNPLKRNLIQNLASAYRHDDEEAYPSLSSSDDNDHWSHPYVGRSLAQPFASHHPSAWPNEQSMSPISPSTSILQAMLPSFMF